MATQTASPRERDREHTQVKPAPARPRSMLGAAPVRPVTLRQICIIVAAAIASAVGDRRDGDRRLPGAPRLARAAEGRPHPRACTRGVVLAPSAAGQPVRNAPRRGRVPGDPVHPAVVERPGGVRVRRRLGDGDLPRHADADPRVPVGPSRRSGLTGRPRRRCDHRRRPGDPRRPPDAATGGGRLDLRLRRSVSGEWPDDHRGAGHGGVAARSGAAGDRRARRRDDRACSSRGSERRSRHAGARW